MPRQNYNDSELLKFKSHLKTYLEEKTDELYAMDPIIKIFDSLLRDELRGKMDKTKMQYLVCCTTNVLQSFDVPVILANVAKAMSVDVKGLIKINQYVKNKYKIADTRINLKKALSRMAREVDAIKKSELYGKKIDGTIELLDVLGFFDGKDRQKAAIHVAYITCLSFIKTEASNYTIGQFCQENKLKDTRNYVKEMVDRILLATKILKLEASGANFYTFLDKLIDKTPLIKRCIQSNDNDDQLVSVQFYSDTYRSLWGDKQMTLRDVREILTTPSTFAKTKPILQDDVQTEDVQTEDVQTEDVRTDHKRRAEKSPGIAPKMARITVDTEEFYDDDKNRRHPEE